MILADTSVWVNHLRSDDPAFAKRLLAGEILIHPYVIGEIVLGSLKNRDRMSTLLNNLPLCEIATSDQVLSFIVKEQLFGRGIGFVDASLLAAVQMTPAAKLWTVDKRLHTVASELGLTI